MGKVRADQSVSLDGFLTGPNVGDGSPFGDGDERLHAWMFEEEPVEQNAMIRDELFGSAGAVVMGRRMFDLGVEDWGDDPPFHLAVFVVTHRARGPLVKAGGTTYHFATGGITDALARARVTAGGHDVAVVGGARTIQACLSGGLLDELRLHLVPLLLGRGTRLFDGVGARPVELEVVRAVGFPGVTHLTLRPRTGWSETSTEAV